MSLLHRIFLTILDDDTFLVGFGRSSHQVVADTVLFPVISFNAIHLDEVFIGQDIGLRLADGCSFQPNNEWRAHRCTFFEHHSEYRFFCRSGSGLVDRNYDRRNALSLLSDPECSYVT